MVLVSLKQKAWVDLGSDLLDEEDLLEEEDWGGWVVVAVLMATTLAVWETVEMEVALLVRVD